MADLTGQQLQPPHRRSGRKRRRATAPALALALGVMTRRGHIGSGGSPCDTPRSGGSPHESADRPDGRGSGVRTGTGTGELGSRPIIRPPFLLPLWMVGLLAVWSTYRLVLWPTVAVRLGDGASVVDALVKIAVWIGPVLLVLRAAAVGDARRYLFLPGNWRAGLLWGLLAAAVLSARWMFAVLTGSTSGAPIDVDQLLVATLVAPSCEEVAFRGLLFGALADLWRSRLLAGAVSSLAFAAIHLPLRVGALGWSWPLVIDLGVLTLYGALFCFLLAVSRSLLAPILAHTAYNVVVLTG